jgi:cytochrome c oxidase assembly protein subunit 15
MSVASNAIWQFSLHWVQALVWVLVLAGVFWMGLKMRWSKLTAVLVFLTLDLVMFGSYVRLTDSGLGCPDWPGCYAKFTPLQAHEQIAQAVEEQGGTQGYVSPFKAWVEMIHRYAGSIIGTLIMVLLSRAFWAKKHGVYIKLGLPIVHFIWLVLQGLFGKWTVTMQLIPLIVTLHLMGGVILLALLAWFWMRNRADLVSVNAGTLTRALLWIAMIAVGIQIFLGGWTSTNYAALACSGFPACNGSFDPNANWAQGFTLWRHLGLTGDGQPITEAALVAIQWGHRLFAIVATAAVFAAVAALWRFTALRRLAMWIAIAVVLQVVFGIVLVTEGHPLIVAVAHNGGSAVLMLLLVMGIYRVSATARQQAPSESLGSAFVKVTPPHPLPKH